MFPAFVRWSLTVTCVFIFITTLSQQQPTPHTLLWRISGKGLAQPSYLYGTMHLQDKRLFQFGDSVYYAIENTQGLATEIDFQETVDSIFQNLDREAEEDKLLAKQKIKFDRGKLDPSALSLLQKFGIKGNVMTAKNLKDIREYRTQSLLQKGEMTTVVDGFLLGIAQRQAKWTGGIEDVNDQLGIQDEIGGELRPESVLTPEKEFRRGVDSMITLYVSQDLDKIDEWSNREYGGQTRDVLLIKRNVKMAYRMDSLSAVRPTFFAVGAAHLPGDSGVIQLLRNRGFRVEPVFSARKIAGDEYASHLKQKEWKEIKGEDNAYTVQMPGNPTDRSKPGEPKMKLFFDLTSMTVYMAGHFEGYDPKTRSLDKAIREAAKNMAGKAPVTPPVPITHQGLQGMETFTTKDGYTFRMRVFAKDKTLFMLMTGSSKKELVNGVDATRFFASFVPGETSTARKPWNEFSIAGKAFIVRMPGKPEPQKAVDEKVAGNPTWDYQTWYSIDPQTDHFYMMQVRQVKSGYTIESDSAYLAALKEDYQSRLDTIGRYEMTTYKGYPASLMEYEDKKVKGTYKMLHVVRGNRVYALMVGAPKGSDMADADSFFNSLVLQPYESVKWQKAEAPGFSTTAPATFRLSPPDSTATTRFYAAEYTSYNEKNATSYVVQKAVFSPHYWAAGDSLLMEEKLATYKGEGDSLLQKTWIQNGGYKGLDFRVLPANGSKMKKVRLLVNRDTLYSLICLVEAREWKDEHEQFFSDFHLADEVPPTIYTSKAAQLLQAMTTSDSTAFAEALADFESVSFDKKDLPLLHKALLETYYDNEEYYSTQSKIAERILPLADHSTLAFVKEAYPKQEGKKEPNKYRLLTLLTQMQTQESFAVLKPLLSGALPKSGNPIPLQRPLLDSLALTAALFPELLQKADDSLLAPVIAAVAGRLLDSSLLTAAALALYKQTILRGAENEYKLLQKKDYEPWELIRWAELLSWMNDADGNAYLERLLRHSDLPLKQAAILALLKNNKAVPAAEITKVAADQYQRLNLYRALKQAGKESLFPALYATQKSLAESEMYHLFADEDYEDFTLTYIGQRTAPWNGAPGLFHLFKVRMAYEDEVKRDYLCVAGPYPVAGKEKLLYGEATGFYGDERYLPQKTDKLFKAYLLSLKPAEK